MSDKIFIGNVKTTPKKGQNGTWQETKISFGPKDFLLFEEHKNKGWVNLLLKKSQSGKIYLEVDTWKPVRQEDFQGRQSVPDVQYNDSMPPPPDDQ